MVYRFALAMTIGIGFGTYSSVYVASSLLLTMKISREDLVSLEKKEEEYDTP